MRLLIQLFLILGVATAPVAVPEDTALYPIPAWYYDCPCQQPAGVTFYDWLETLIMPPHVSDAFDCSQMAAYIEWLAENCGHRAVIVGRPDGEIGHTWVMIEIDNVFLAYESTWATATLDTSPWIASRDDWHYSPDTEWESIHDSPRGTSFEVEYAWWLTHPELRQGRET